jgi:hypothetical protein
VAVAPAPATRHGPHGPLSHRCPCVSVRDPSPATFSASNHGRPSSPGARRWSISAHFSSVCEENCALVRRGAPRRRCGGCHRPSNGSAKRNRSAGAAGPGSPSRPPRRGDPRLVVLPRYARKNDQCSISAGIRHKSSNDRGKPPRAATSPSHALAEPFDERPAAQTRVAWGAGQAASPTARHETAAPPPLPSP